MLRSWSPQLQCCLLSAANHGGHAWRCLSHLPAAACLCCAVLGLQCCCRQPSFQCMPALTLVCLISRVSLFHSLSSSVPHPLVVFIRGYDESLAFRPLGTSVSSCLCGVLSCTSLCAGKGVVSFHELLLPFFCSHLFCTNLFRLVLYHMLACLLSPFSLLFYISIVIWLSFVFSFCAVILVLGLSLR